MKNFNEGFWILFLGTGGLEFFKMIYDYILDQKSAFALVCIAFIYVILSPNGSTK